MCFDLKAIAKAALKIVFALTLSASIISNAIAEIRFQDDFGNEVRLEEAAERIISLAPHITELVFAAGAGKQLVGAVSYSDYPEEAKKVSRIGTYKQVSYEAILALKPDLVLAWRSGNGEDVSERLRSLGLVVHESEPETLEDVAKTLRDYGVLSGHQQEAEARASEFLGRLSTLRQQYSRQTPVGVYYQIWNEPLLTLNDDHIISDVVRLCGGQNIFANAVSLVSKISVESVIREDPQVVIASGMGEARPEWLDEWRKWPSIKAVEAGQLYFVPPDLLQRHTLRIMDGAEQVCKYLDLARKHYQGIKK